MFVELANTHLFRDLSAAAQARLVALGRRRYFHAHDVLVREGSPNEWFHLITVGHVQLRLEHSGGQLPTELGVLRRGDIIGADWLLHGGNPAVTARALDEVETFCLSHLAVALILLQFPEAAAPFYAGLRRVAR
jgi:CRP-like cAMP-binding protein